MAKPVDITGKVFGRLTAIERDGNDKWGQALWLCRCECGAEPVIRAGSLLRGATQSCGCLRRERVAELKHRWWGDHPEQTESSQ